MKTLLFAAVSIATSFTTDVLASDYVVTIENDALVASAHSQIDTQLLVNEIKQNLSINDEIATMVAQSAEEVINRSMFVMSDDSARPQVTVASGE